MGTWATRERCVRLLGISLLISSLVHIPLPQPDFHNVRHHDAEGEVCVYHDHLLRWHPSAGQNADIALLHWHWVLPVLDGSAEDGSESGDGQHRPGSGPAFHAHLGDGFEPDWSASRWVSPDVTTISLEGLACPLAIDIGSLGRCSDTVLHPPEFFPLRSSPPPHAHSVLHLSLQRWNC